MLAGQLWERHPLGDNAAEFRVSARRFRTLFVTPIGRIVVDKESQFQFSLSSNIGQVSSEPILVGGNNLLKLALRRMSDYRLRVEEIKGSEIITCYTRSLESVQTRGAETQEVYLTFSPHLERIWPESKKRLSPTTGKYRTFEVSTRFGFTVGRKSISRRVRSAFHWRSFEKCSAWSQ